MARYLVTGGAGFIGGHLVAALVRQGHPVVVLDDLSSGKRASVEGLDGVTLLEGCITDRGACQQAVEGVESCFHLAAMPSVVRSLNQPVRTTEVNVTGTVQLLRAAADAGVRRVVFASSSSVYGDTEVLPKHEAMAPEPLSPYALQKLTGEQFTLKAQPFFGIEGTALRFFNVYGPRQDPDSPYSAVIPLFIRQGLRGLPMTINGDGEQTRDFTYVQDVVAALIAASLAPGAPGQVFNTGAGARISINELARLIREALDSPDAPPPTHGPPRPGDVRDSLADISKAGGILGWAPEVSLADGLGRTVAWMRESG